MGVSPTVVTFQIWRIKSCSGRKSNSCKFVISQLTSSIYTYMDIYIYILTTMINSTRGFQHELSLCSFWVLVPPWSSIGLRAFQKPSGLEMFRAWWFHRLQSLHPCRLTWNIIMEVGKMIFLSKWVIYRFLIFQGVPTKNWWEAIHPHDCKPCIVIFSFIHLRDM